MRTGRTLAELAEEMERRKESKVDYLLDTRLLHMAPTADEVFIPSHIPVEKRTIDQPAFNNFGVNLLAHQQIREKLKIPAKYYELMRETAPDLLATNVNHWWQNKPGDRLVRTLDGRIRAYLSSSFDIDMSDEACLSGVLNALSALPQQTTVESCDVTDRYLYVKVSAPWLRGNLPSKRDARVGDAFDVGLIFTTSEVGLRGLHVNCFFKVLSCLNGCWFEDMGYSRRHVGKRREVTRGEVEVTYSRETEQSRARTISLEIRDAVSSILHPRTVTMIENMASKASERELGDDVPAGVKVLSSSVGLIEDEEKSVLRHLIEGGDLSQWGLAQAVTRAAEDARSYDRATEMEAMGGKVISLNETQWESIAKAA